MSVSSIERCNGKNIHEIPSLQLGKTLSLELYEYSRIFKRPIPASYFKLIQAVEISWIFKNIQAHKCWKFLAIPSSIFLQVHTLTFLSVCFTSAPTSSKWVNIC